MSGSDEASKWAEAISEGMNCLGIFLCGPAFAKLRDAAPELLRRWEADYAPAFRKIETRANCGDQVTFLSALARLSSIAKAGVDFDSADQLATLREAIGAVFTAMRMPLPVIPRGEAAVCELHGPACPVRAASER